MKLPQPPAGASSGDRSPAVLALATLVTFIALTGCGLLEPQEDPRTPIVVRACDDAVAALGEERAARIVIAAQTGSAWRLEMWQAGNVELHARPDHTCIASMDEDGFVTVESLR